MGKRIGTQRRGRGAARYTAPSHRFKSEAKYKPGNLEGVVTDFEKDASKTTVMMKIAWKDGTDSYYLAPEGVFTEQGVVQGTGPVNIGNILPLASIPEGTPIFNIENVPGDGGKTIRSSGTNGIIINRVGDKVNVKLPSKKIMVFNAQCRATVGIAAGGGRLEKPLLKAGNAVKKNRARGHRYPHVRGVAMNPVNHPHGGKEHHTGKPTTVSRNAPPGQKVGHIAARRVGRKKRK
ncbi:MAG: 50S ribosomal protein L2 [Candidatus Diapherotrites archaeon]|nr:50S ribosomal protein L2 [Candidatus Diapherotrites archaeon]